MNYPQQPHQGYPAQADPYAQPQQQAPYPPQGYPQQVQPPIQPQFPQAPPQQGGYPPQGYPAQPYPPQGYGQPGMAPPGPQQPPLVQGTLADFYNQPSTGGGPSLKFEQLNTRYVGVVTRAIGSGDVQQQTDTQGRPLTFRDGRPKWVMKVPLQMQPSATYPDGLAQWYVKGGSTAELTRAMAEAGCPESVIQAGPEAGAVIDVTFVSTRNSGPGMNPAKVFRVNYQRPNGTAAAAPVEAPQQQAQPVQQQAPQGVDFSQLQPQQGQYQPQQQPTQQIPGQQPYQAPAQPTPQPQQGQPYQQFPQQGVATGAPSPAPDAAQQWAQQGQPVQQMQQPAPQAPAPLDASQAAIIAQLTSTQAGQPVQGQPAA